MWDGTKGDLSTERIEAIINSTNHISLLFMQMSESVMFTLYKLVEFTMHNMCHMLGAYPSRNDSHKLKCEKDSHIDNQWKLNVYSQSVL